jgi:hypothetical protein
MLLNIGVGCIISSLTVYVVETPDGWNETVELTVVSQGQCTTLEMSAPRDELNSLVHTKLRIPGHRTKAIAPELVQLLPGDVERGPTTRFHLGELVGGDALELKYTHSRTESGPYVWRPNGDEVVFGEIKPPTGLQVAVIGDITQEDGWYWSEDIMMGTEISISHSKSWVPPATASLPVLTTPTVSRAIELNIPARAPLAALAIGGNSSASITDTLQFPETTEDLAWFSAKPLEAKFASLNWSGRHRVYDDGVLLLSTPSQPKTAKIQWVLADAPTFGRMLTPNGQAIETTVSGIGVTAEHTGLGEFVVTQVGSTAIIQDRAHFVKALSYRFRNAMMIATPAPIPPASASTPRAKIASLINTLKSEFTVSDTLPIPALHPRPIRKAKRSGLVTPLEAALIITEAAEQLGLSATWALFRPDNHEANGGTFNPAGYTDALVRFSVDSQAIWVAPNCSDCATFELPPEASGTPVISPLAERTPLTPQSDVTISTRDNTVSVTLNGAPALLLRRALTDVRSARRTRYLLDLIIGGPGKLVFFKNIDKAGAMIKIIAQATDSPNPLDPFRIPDTDETRKVDMTWVGTRTEMLSGSNYVAAHISNETFEYSLICNEYGQWSRSLTLYKRFIPQEDILALHAIFK